jgi:hypothetical protein
MSFYEEESIREIVKDIDCLQETEQRSVIIEYNWRIDDIFDLISSKRPGEKIESEQFSYTKESNKSKENQLNEDRGLNIDRGLNSYCVKCSSKSQHKGDCVTANGSNNGEIRCRSVNTANYLNYELQSDYFLKSSLWRLEINKSSSDPEYLAINVTLIREGYPLIEKFISNPRCSDEKANICQQQQQQQQQNHQQSQNLYLKLKLYLLNGDMNELFESQLFETKIDLKKFFSNSKSGVRAGNGEQNNNEQHSTAAFLHKSDEQRRQRLIEKYSIDRFCKTKDLLRWLNKRGSDDFCLLAEFKLYKMNQIASSDDLNTFDYAKSRLKTKLCSYKSVAPDLACKTPPLASTTPSQSPVSRLDDSSLSAHVKVELTQMLNCKQAWSIKSWKNFLMLGNKPHTFMNDTDLSNIFAPSSNTERSSNPKFGVGNQAAHYNDEENNMVKFDKLKSKLFRLTNVGAKSCELANCQEKLTKSRIEDVLKDVKWKLQLYPNGYNEEFENNMSLFVNFSQLAGNLAKFLPQVTNKKSYNTNSITQLMNMYGLRSTEETFYDADDNAGVVLLIKSPCASNKTFNELFDEQMPESELEMSEFLCNNLNTIEKKKRKKFLNSLNGMYETFVKASFQISIMDSNGKRVDKCQSEKQLFELFGSWG